jgi:predicted AAA+ superfamily ATPase
MERLFKLFRQNIKRISPDFKRSLINKIDWSEQLIAIVGARGSGKTTLMFQYIKENLPLDNRTLYASLDDIYFYENKLVDLAEKFIEYGGKYLFIDEVHKYPTWSIEVKNLYDNYPDLKIVISGSSILEIFKSYADLSRRIIVYHLPEMSFREFVEFHTKVKLKPHKLNEIIENHTDITNEICSHIEPLPLFKKYLKYGAYPFFAKNINRYHEKLRQIIETVLDIDIPQTKNIEVANIAKMKRLLGIISASSPFKPNISNIAKVLDVHRNTLLQYMHHLMKAEIIYLLTSDKKGDGQLAKPEKIYLHNSNIMYAMNENPDIGNIRETFFVNQITMSGNTLKYPHKGDFVINDKYIFEIGGKGKKFKQIADVKNSFVVADDIKYSFNNKLPLWLFGLLY